jgi:NAD(P)-dependent dehydrogenase (short-subunit alcohol dehydrogenase family)
VAGSFTFSQQSGRRPPERAAMKRSLIIIGAAGGVGSGVAAAAVEAGYHVVAVGRTSDSLEALASTHPDGAISTVRGSFETEEQAVELVRELRGLRRRFVGVVASIRPPIASGRLIERPAQILRDTFDQNVVPHFIAAKHLFPMLAESNRGALYLVIGCATSDFAWAGYGHVSVGAAARKMLVHVLREESKDLPLRIQLLQIEGQVSTHKNANVACHAWMQAEVVGRQVVTLLEQSDGRESVVHLRGVAVRPDTAATLKEERS